MLLSKVSPVFKVRRERLMSGHPGAVFIFPSNPEQLRNPDVSQPYRQESSFQYLAGYPEPESILVLAGGKTYLFVQQRNQEREMWEGERYGTDRVKQIFGVDEAFATEDFELKALDLLRNADQVFYRVNFNAEMDRRVLTLLERVRKSFGRSGRGLLPVFDPQEPVGEMRLFKDAEEVGQMRRAAQISAEAHKEIMRLTRPGMNERDISVLIDYLFLKGGCQRIAYGTIVAGGKNAACLHYRFNNDPLRDGELLLIDAGGEYDYYGADITRTFPISKRFSPKQVQAYDLVLRAQMEGIKLAKPGSTQSAIHRRACEVLVEGFLSMGILTGSAESILNDLSYKRFYPHNTGHYLGMDVHDVGIYMRGAEHRPLEPGMVFTIEPGFYIQPGDPLVGQGYEAMGIRIEDDILITNDGCEILTGAVPKQREEIEALRA